MSTIKFSATKLPTNKLGVLKPDETGAYTMPIGGLNAYNSIGQYYTYKGVESLFQSSSILMRRVSNGNLKGEVGHPKRLPGMSFDDYVTRILTIDETNVCCHFSEIWLDMDYGKNHPELKNPDLIAIMGKIRPSGPKGDFLRQAFENQGENVCFSIRSMTRDYYQKGTTFREIKNVLTFDFVTEPGISFATKFNSPALESMIDLPVTMGNLERVLQNNEETFAMESTKALAVECLQSGFGERLKKSSPLYKSW